MAEKPAKLIAKRLNMAGSGTSPISVSAIFAPVQAKPLSKI
jgi:hypothetical protein